MIPTQHVLDFCSGSGGFTLAMAPYPQLKTIAFCENNKHAIATLQKNFPSIPIIKDISDVTVSTLQSLGIQQVDGIVGGFPCQPHSCSGNKKASEDERDLWPEIARILRDIRPRWAVFENVPGLLTSENRRFFRGILRDLASLDFDAESGIIPCATVATSDGRLIGAGGVHKRERIWIITYSNRERQRQSQKQTDTCGDRRASRMGTEERNYRHRNGCLFITTDANRNGLERSERRNFWSSSLSKCFITNAQSSRRIESRDSDAQAGSNFTFECGCNDGDSICNRCQQQLQTTDQGRTQSELGNGMQPQSLAQSALCSSDDGLPLNLGGYLMRLKDLQDWLPYATIPTLQRPLRLYSSEIKQLSPEDRAEYQRLCNEYRDEYNRAIESLCNAEKAEYRQLQAEYKRYRTDYKNQLERYGNAIVPQVAVKVFARLIEILEQSYVCRTA